MEEKKRRWFRKLSRYETDSLGVGIVLILGAIFVLPYYNNVIRFGTTDEKVAIEIGRQLCIWTGIYWLVVYGIVPLVGNDKE